eukprot:CAMPEP_0117452794 /NCGR_PEP_ID=MMETSP0759-20121206/9829_1 /TAXON_ID=63605 /ORGANISM="Percolomonas cosmopolitus, Strain WS" /LENGTH=939 /DNA_ID=CAMNT_0005245681 /DNA_START=141 /DNA_END=2961 /DNA_ORIENTATION=+
MPAPPLHIVTFNVHSWLSSKMQHNAGTIAELLSRRRLWYGVEEETGEDGSIEDGQGADLGDTISPPDVVALQEVASQWTFTPTSDNESTSASTFPPDHELLQHDDPIDASSSMPYNLSNSPLRNLAQHLNCNYISGYADVGLGNALMYCRDRLECVDCERFSAKEEIRRCSEEGIIPASLSALNLQQDRCMLRATFRHKQTQGVFDVFTTHLDHESGSYRLQMLRAFLNCIQNVQKEHAQETQNYLGCILCGDFNAMTRSDYTDYYVKSVQQYFWDSFRVRELDFWTCAHVTAQNLPNAGFVDTWKIQNSALKDRNAATSRIHTRIDYVFSKCLLPTRESHIVLNDLQASDHHPVCTTFDARPRRVTFIMRGLGRSKVGYLNRRFPEFFAGEHPEFHLLDLPEPSEDMSGGLKVLKAHIRETQPELIVASSRGAQFVSQLIESCSEDTMDDSADDFVLHPNISFLLLSAMCRCVSNTNPILFVHGIHDVSIPLRSIQNLVAQGKPDLVQIEHLEDDHSLSTITKGDILLHLMIRTLNMKHSHICMHGTEGVFKQSTTKRAPSTKNSLLDEIRQRGSIRQQTKRSRSRHSNPFADHLKVFLTGFGKFAGVSENPSSLLCGYVQKHGDLFPNVKTVDVLEVSIEGVESYFDSLQHLIETHTTPDDNILLLHLGVAAASPEFKIERVAVNEASFRVKDEQDNQPFNEPIVDNFNVDHSFCTTLCVSKIAKLVNNRLCSWQTENGLPFLSATRPQGGQQDLIGGDNPDTNCICTTSENAGRFLCNYIYAKSLWYSQNAASKRNICSLFVHVPSMTTYPDEKQIIFFCELYNTLTGFYDPHEEGRVIEDFARAQLASNLKYSIKNSVHVWLCNGESKLILHVSVLPPHSHDASLESLEFDNCTESTDISVNMAPHTFSAYSFPLYKCVSEATCLLKRAIRNVSV